MRSSETVAPEAEDSGSRSEVPGGTIEVRTPKGRAIVLPAGSIVLDFAASIHTKLILYALGARIKRRGVPVPLHVGLLHALRDGDQVKIRLARSRQAIPGDVLARMDKKQRKDLRHAYREASARRGRLYLQQHLMEAGVCPVQEGDELDSLVRDALGDPRATDLPTNVATVHGFYSGLYAHFTPASGDTAGALQADHVLLMLRLTFQRAAVGLARHAFGQRADGKRLRHCRRCGGTALVAPLLELRSDDGIIVCHSPSNPCEEAKAAECHTVQPCADQYFYVEALDRSGLIADVSQIFENVEVQITELVARSTGRREAAIRIRIEPTPPRTVRRVTRLLRRIHGVTRRGVHGPEADVTASESAHFEPRRTPGRTRARFPFLPYDVGERIRREDRLYGREHELADLTGRISAAIDFDQPSDGSIFVHGPFKVGKSSLVSTALSVLRRAPREIVIVHLDAVRGESWSAYITRVLNDLWIQAAQYLETIGGDTWKTYLDRGRGGVESPTSALLRLTQILMDHRIATVIAIDEVMWLLKDTTEDAKEVEQCARALHTLRDGRGVALIFIGPDLEGLPLAPSLRTVIRTSRKVEVTPFGPETSAQVLVARRSRLPIEADPEVEAAVFDETLGHPYWIQLLASELWKTVAEPAEESWKVGAVRYTVRAFELALNIASETTLPFEQQYEPFLDGEMAAVTRAALPLFIGDAYGERKGQGITLAALDDYLTTATSSAIPASEWLRQMEQVGTLVRSREFRTWRMAPILARHLMVKQPLTRPRFP